jgi:hypothetical protein
MRGVHPLAPEAPVAPARVQDMKPSPALQIIGKMKDTLMGSAIGMIADGSDGAVIAKIKKAATDGGWIYRRGLNLSTAGQCAQTNIKIMAHLI